ncbi:sensor histidine kinase [Kineococcus glutinatus]|uniref:histidine kinase n=1 Tax=Kineococcus glutinatus TaxID=1070872 RepID=A0ABP9H6M3_9ACTN
MDGPAAGARRRSGGTRPADAVVPLLIAAVGTAELVGGGYDHLAAALGTFWLAALVLVVRRRLPVVAPPAVGGCYALAAALGVDIGGPASWILLLVLASSSAGRYPPWERHLPGLLAVTACLAITYLALGALSDFEPDLLFGLLGTYVPWLLGRLLRRELDRAATAAAEAERERARRERDVEAAAAAERERIARELHDVLAHSLSVMVVQASLAEDVLGHDPETAARAVRAVQRCGREALAETGRLLRLVRDDAGELGLAPGPVLADLPALAEEFGRAGMPVALVRDGTVDDLPTGLQLSVYRIVQEALTNALKHAPGSRAEVRLVRCADAVRVEVRNGPAASPAAPVPGGHGLPGVRERVALFGGSLEHGGTPDGGYALAVSVPVEVAP